MTILILNGPNLNLLGEREPQIYGRQRFEDYLDLLRTDFPPLNLIYHQSNVEGELINLLHEYRTSAQGIVLNAGGYTHTSIALADAVAAIPVPVIEVHLSNVYAREEFRKTSFIAPVCVGSISGFGLESYRLALHFFLRSLSGN
ncbi:MAG: type II 3-dehydroquinate dehydratase [Sphingobacteriales bacterium]|nr:MAG: type II 3-dehydroquinate dehydratase [Sphingobacteriales bacterium]